MKKQRDWLEGLPAALAIGGLAFVALLALDENAQADPPPQGNVATAVGNH